MDLSSLDLSHGISFADEVRSLFGFPVCSPSPDDASSFWLIAAFSHSKFRMTVDSVGSILQSVIGGSSDLFSVVELEQQLFKFTVLNRQVGLRVYNLKSFSCDAFKLFFHLWNPSGLASAWISSTLDSGPRYDWVQKSSKRTGKSYVDALKTPAPGSHSTKPSASRRSVFSRLNFCSIPDGNLRFRH